MLDCGAGKAHRWTNAPNQPILLPSTTKAGKFDPQTLAQETAQDWGPKWGAGNTPLEAEAHAAHNELRALAQALKHPNLEELMNEHTIKAAACSFKASTSLGVDNMPFRHIADSGSPALKELALLLRTAATEMALPHQTLLNIMVMLPKKLGGHRTIALCPTYTRLLLALLKGEFRQWDAEASKIPGVTDTAAPGVHAQLVTIQRAAQIEAAHLLGETTILILWDVKQFYASIKIPQLVKDIKDTQMPYLASTLAIQGHMAPRALQVQEALSTTIGHLSNSILEGCTSSTSFARATLKRPVALGVSEYVTIGEHVDDVSQLTISQHSIHAVQTATDSAENFIKAVEAKQFTVAEKSVILSNNKKVAHSVSKALFDRGVRTPQGGRFPIVTQAEDLGIETARNVPKTAGYSSQQEARERHEKSRPSKHPHNN